jgi:peptide-methionine (R)-S-oxide reductase|tara:strand:+ start:1847 stop:2239 length:393 start_codon:yes stop_codon:yes gene_type:complete
MSNYPIQKTEAQWKELLGDAKYKILREKGTERPFTGSYNLTFEDGTYACMGCQNKLFESSSKFDSGCGWPSFDQSIAGSVTYIKDTTLGMVRTEIVCSNCGGHLGHVFDDGPTKTGQRYCVNSLSVDLKK